MANSGQDRHSAADRSTCPLCGGPNLCALAADPDAAECWCDSVVFPDELLARIPKEAVRKTCVCQKCLEAHLDSGRASQAG